MSAGAGAGVRGACWPTPAGMRVPLTVADCAWSWGHIYVRVAGRVSSARRPVAGCSGSRPLLARPGRDAR